MPQQHLDGLDVRTVRRPMESSVDRDARRIRHDTKQRGQDSRSLGNPGASMRAIRRGFLIR